VPESVPDELREMAARLDAMVAKLYAYQVPPGFEESLSWLAEAAMYMGSRIQATVAGIEIMWSTGTVSSADDFFNEGRQHRDAYRKAIAKYHDVVPVE
jgi:hypothetical protein